MPLALSWAWSMIATVCLLTGAIGVMLANRYAQMMIQEINRRRDDPMSEFFFTPMKTLRVFEEYRRLYPSGRLNLWAIRSAGLAGIALSIGFLLLLKMITP